MDAVGYGFFRTLFELELDVARAVQTQDRGDLDDRIEIASLTARMNQQDLYNDMPSIESRLDRMRRRLEEVPRAAKRQAANISVKTVRDTFYNLMVNVGFDQASLDRQELPRLLVALTLIEAMDSSRGVEGILCTSQDVLTVENCPETYLPLARGLLKIKEPVIALSASQLACLKRGFSLSHDPVAANLFAGHEDQQPLEMLAQKIRGMVEAIAGRPEFQEIIADVLQYFRECKTGVEREEEEEEDTRPIDSVEVSEESKQGVTEELVRESFYQTMAAHALLVGLITKEALEFQEGYIYFALSHHAIIRAMVVSRVFRGAIALLNGKFLTLDNCPEKYKPLAQTLFGLKTAVCSLSPEQRIVLKSSSIRDPDFKLPEKLAALITTELNVLSSKIENVAQQISQFQTFKDIIAEVIKFVTPSDNGE